MLNILRNTSIYLLRNKDFVKFITIMPTILFLLMTVLLPYSVDLLQRNIRATDYSTNRNTAANASANAAVFHS